MSGPDQITIDPDWFAGNIIGPVDSPNLNVPVRGPRFSWTIFVRLGPKRWTRILDHGPDHFHSEFRTTERTNCRSSTVIWSSSLIHDSYCLTHEG